MTSPERIGPYRIERLLGTGSFATVWLGHDPLLDAPVAIKVLAENWHHDLRVRERFLDEARLLRRIDDDRLVRAHGVGELPDGRPYVVLSLADGGSLRDRLAAGPLPVPAALDLLAEIAAGVAVLHRHGVVHRDLTPGNVLFRSHPDGERVLVADLGLAKALAAASGLTARAGTPGYMAPEQDDPLAVVDTRADVYGLGRLGLRLLGAPCAPMTDAGPSDADQPVRPDPDADQPGRSGTDADQPGRVGTDVGERGRSGPDVDGGRDWSGTDVGGWDRGGDGPPRLREGVPSAVAEVLRRATAYRPADRYPDAAAFRAALRDAAPTAGRSDAPGRPAADGRIADGRDASGPGGGGRVDGGLADGGWADGGWVDAGWEPEWKIGGPPSASSGGPSSAGPRRRGRRWLSAAGAGVAVLAVAGVLTGDASALRPDVPVGSSGPLTVALPPGWRAAGSGWAGQYGPDGGLEPALVVSPDPDRWPVDPTVPGAFVGVSAAIAARTTPDGFVAERPHADCAAEPVRRTRQAGVDWVVARYACARGRPVIVEAAGLGPDRSGLLYVQVTPPSGSDPGFVDRLLAGVRAR
ncbi:serine/threonine-protein kinase [Micromonospora sp. WMMD882]|uniref:protein kinase domain-containing protein n=1 Tax=Micromonospora sp. WMMD882 TaxID=3015151 RepID=UPI00248D158D|nr:serine/threonine-protein kinase [Micromonospora sp. WMMD882]WBB81422.1 serine/threonine-protein kinase [Micromonospora sp. WMMD882]